MIGIWGAGREGLAAAQALASESVLVVDELGDSRPDALPLGTRFASGSSALEALLDCSEVIVSPGVPRVHPFRARLDAAGIDITSLTDRWLRAAHERTIGVTGTKGKSTTATLLHLLLQAAGLDAQLGGNIGVPLANLRPDAQVTVAELSSYQCASIRIAPRIAVITSFYEDHLTWHGSKDAYWQDKAKIAAAGCEVLVCDAETLAKLRSIDMSLPERVLALEDAAEFPVSIDSLPAALRLAQNLHNLQLAMLAANTWLERALTEAEILAALEHFHALPHRLDHVGEAVGLFWIDDTLSTVPESVIAAAEAFGGEATLIVGGEDRGLHYGVLSEYLLQRQPLAQVIAIPTSGSRIAEEYEASHPDLVHRAPSLEEAVRLAALISSPGSTVLLSPGAPSYDHFKDFEHKSAAFVQAIDKLRAHEALL